MPLKKNQDVFLCMKIWSHLCKVQHVLLNIKGTVALCIHISQPSFLFDDFTIVCDFYLIFPAAGRVQIRQ